MIRFFKQILFLIVAFSVIFPIDFVLAQSLSSPNYKLEDPEIDVGGGLSTSANFQSQDALATEDQSQSNSTNFNLFPGFIKKSFPHVPATPTFVNTGGTLTTALDFVINQGNGNASDVQYAIAISSDNFVTTNYVQADDTVASTTVWQTYTAWGAAVGQRITGLAASTTYKIKVKARYGVNTETAFSSTATAATVAGGGFTFTITGVSSGTSVTGVSTTSDATATGIAFGSLSNDTNYTAAQILAVTSGSGTGYTVTAKEDHSLMQSGGVATIGDFNAAATDNPTQGGFGYALQNKTGTDAVFHFNDSAGTFTSKGFQTSPVTVMSNVGAVSGSEVYIAYRLRISQITPPGGYSNQITLTGSADF